MIKCTDMQDVDVQLETSWEVSLPSTDIAQSIVATYFSASSPYRALAQVALQTVMRRCRQTKSFTVEATY